MRIKLLLFSAPLRCLGPGRNAADDDSPAPAAGGLRVRDDCLRVLLRVGHAQNHFPSHHVAGSFRLDGVDIDHPGLGGRGEHERRQRHPTTKKHGQKRIRPIYI